MRQKASTVLIASMIWLAVTPGTAAWNGEPGAAAKSATTLRFSSVNGRFICLNECGRPIRP